MTGWDTRAEIGLRPPRAISTNINPTRGVAFHYGGGGPYKRTNHADCRAVWRAFQAWHMAPDNTNNYTDIAYNMGVCHHDVILEGRSTATRPKVRGGANGDAVVNGNRYSICSIWGSFDGAPPDGLKTAYLAARQFLRDKGDAGDGTNGHRDMAQTSCPGDGIYAWIRAGCPAPDQGDDDVTPEEITAAVREANRPMALRIEELFKVQADAHRQHALRLEQLFKDVLAGHQPPAEPPTP